MKVGSISDPSVQGYTNIVQNFLTLSRHLQWMVVVLPVMLNAHKSVWTLTGQAARSLECSCGVEFVGDLVLVGGVVRCQSFGWQSSIAPYAWTHLKVKRRCHYIFFEISCGKQFIEWLYVLFFETDLGMQTTMNGTAQRCWFTLRYDHLVEVVVEAIKKSNNLV